jgi:voltage-gated potassium channel Kch
MALRVLYAIALVLGTTLIHTGFTIVVLGWLRSHTKDHWVQRGSVTRAFALAFLVVTLSMAAYLESTLWAGFYWAVGALPTLADALYFSLVTFTTLGYGDITLDEEWRVLAAFEAANGIIIFGWTTAIIVAAVQRLFLRDSADTKNS